MRRNNWALALLLVVAGLLVLVGTDFIIKIIVMLMSLASIATAIFNVVKLRAIGEDTEKGSLFLKVLVVQSAVSLVFGIIGVVRSISNFQDSNGHIGIAVMLSVIFFLSSLVMFFLAFLIKDNSTSVKPLIQEAVAYLIIGGILVLLAVGSKSTEELGSDGNKKVSKGFMTNLFRICGGCSVLAGFGLGVSFVVRKQKSEDEVAEDENVEEGETSMVVEDASADEAEGEEQTAEGDAEE